MNPPQIATPAEWLERRRILLEKEKELTRLRDELASERQKLPWVRLEKNYEFQGASGKVRLSELFGDKSQLIIYHFMFGPGWSEGCPSCSLMSDQFDATLCHLAARDVAFAVVSRAPYAEIASFKKRLGWGFPWVSSFETDFNRDYNVSFSREEVNSGRQFYNFGPNGFPSEEGPGISVFARDDSGALYHTYSTYARGAEPMLNVYQFLDITPKGRAEQGLPWPMAWVRHHDRYEGPSAA